MGNEQRIQELFQKYIDRTATPEEVEEFFQLMGERDAEDALFLLQRDIWESSRGSDSHSNVDWPKMYEKVIHSEEITPPRRKSKLIGMSAAASVLLILGLAIIYFRPQSPGPRVVAGSENIPPSSPPLKMGKQTIHLPDGSTVVLNSESRLQYPATFEGTNRDVYLFGEAFFDVVHDARHPFIVHVGLMSVKVLGTAFNVKSIAGQRMVQVTVTRGKVEVRKNNSAVGILGVSEQLSYDMYKDSAYQSMVDTVPVLAWKPKELFLNDMTFEDAAEQIEKKFKSSIVFTSAIVKKCRFSATFSETDSLDEMLTVICAITNTTFIKQEDKIIINGKGCTD